MHRILLVPSLCVLALSTAELLFSAEPKTSTDTKSPTAPPSASSATILHWHLDRAAVQSWTACEPFAFLTDKTSATAAAHVERQLRLMDNRPYVPPLFALLFDGNMAAFDAWPTSGRGRFGTPSMRFVVDASAAFPKFSKKMRELTLSNARAATAAAEVDGFRGDIMHARRSERIFLGTNGTSVMFSTAAELEARPWARPATNEARLVFDGSTLIESLWNYWSDEEQQLCSTLWGESLKGLKPSGELSIAPRDGVFASTTVLRGLGRVACGTITAQTATWIPDNAQIAVALAIPRATVLHLQTLTADKSQPLHHLLGDEQIVHMLSTLSTVLDGQIALHGGWKNGPIPEATLLLGLSGTADRAALDKLLNQTLAEFGAEKATIAGADSAWTVLLGQTFPLFIGRNAQRLVIATDAELASKGLAGAVTAQAVPVQIPAGSGLWMRADCQAIGRQWLPLAWSVLGKIKETMGHDSLRNVSYLMNEVTNNIKKNDIPESSTTWSVLFPKENASFQTWIQNSLTEHFGDRDGVDAGAAIWSPVTDADGTEDESAHHSSHTSSAILITRSATKAWEMFSSQGRASLSAEELAKTLKGRTKVAGPAHDKLRIIPFPEIAVFDKRWLPPMATVIAHLRPWQVSMRSTATGAITIDEQGLPVLTALGTIGAHGGWVMTHQLAERTHAKRMRAVMERYEDSSPKLIEAFKALNEHTQKLRMHGMVVEGEAKPTEIPAKPSLIPDLDLEACAALFGDSVAIPTAADIDRLGVWNPKANYGEPLWLIRLDATYAISLSQWSGLEVVEAPSDLPQRPRLGK